MAFSKKAQEIIDDFAKQNGVTDEHVQNLEDAIQSSSVLNEQFNYVANKGMLPGLKASTEIAGYNAVVSMAVKQTDYPKAGQYAVFR